MSIEDIDETQPSAVAYVASSKISCTDSNIVTIFQLFILHFCYMYCVHAILPSSFYVIYTCL